MKDDVAEIPFQFVLLEAVVRKSGMDRDLHSLKLFIKQDRRERKKAKKNG